MNALLFDDYLNEPERYELHEHESDWDWTRRDFFRIVGGGVVVALLLGERVSAQPPGRRGQRPGDRPQEIGAWLHIGEDSSITAFTGKVEIGQNIRTSLTQAIAEELHTPLARIKLVMADTGLVPFDGGTAGSRSTPDMATQLRKVAAAAREALIGLAAEEAKLERDKLSVVDGRVVAADGKPTFEFGQLTKGKKLLKTIADAPEPTKAETWTVAGKSIPKVDGREFVTGKHEYASDVRRPGMLFGRVLRPPAFKAKLASLQTKEAESLPGVKVVRVDDFVGVVAPTEQLAIEAIAAMKAEWTTVTQPSAKELFQYLKEHPGGRGGPGGGGRGGGSQGSIDDGLKAADKTLSATYTIAYIAHVPMEPRAAVAEWTDDKLLVWTGTQMPFRVRSEVATAVGVNADRVRIVVPDMGSGYGGKHNGEAAVEAAKLAKAAGAPVKLVWTREEEFTWAYFRPAGVIEVNAGVKADGTLTAWEFHNYNSGGSAIQTPYDVPNRKTEFHPTESPLRQGSYRALASTANIFARESHMDDLARAVGMDPLAFRLKNLRDARLRAVLEAAATQFGWNRLKPTPGRGFGLACGTEKGSYLATCAEVEIDLGRKTVRVVRAVSAFECGAIVNPDHLRNQAEGALTMGLGGALFEHIDFENGKILNPSFADYRLPRFRDVPEIEVVLLDRKDLKSAGAGETPIVGIAPAIGNAICQATGTRLRSLPMVPNGLKS
jgi:CO/xanthine dehydrogenase Mo-binding subunit